MEQFLIVGTRDGVAVVRRENRAWERVVWASTIRRVESVSVHESTILIGTTEGILRSDDLGENWRPSSGGLTVPHLRWLAYHPELPATVIAGTEPAAIFLSRDGGESWRERPEVAQLRDRHGWYLPYSPEAGCVRGLAFHGERIYAAVEQGGLLRSDDAGETWRLVGGSTGETSRPAEGFIHADVHSVEVHPSSPDLIFAPTGGGFYTSTDGGRTWQLRYDSYCRAVWVDPEDLDHLVLSPADGVDRNGRIEESTDGGQSWRPASNGLAVPWPRHMVNRFLQVNDELLAVLSNGELVAAPLKTLEWQRILPDVKGILAVATMGK